MNFKIYPIGSCPDFNELAKSFNSSNEGIDDFLRQRCLKYDKERRLKTFVLLDPQRNKLVGFFSSTVGVLERKIKKDDGTEAVSLPYVNLAYFAIDSEYQKKGIGRAMMMEFFSMCMVISLYTGISLIYLESVDESVRFYEKLGYHLQDERLRPELYQEYGTDTSKMDFPMLINISNLVSNGHTPYSKNILPIDM